MKPNSEERPPWRGSIPREALWTAVVIALAAVGIAALWPKDMQPRATSSEPSQIQTSPGEVYRLGDSELDMSTKMPSDDQLAAPRAAARLKDCPKPSETGTSPGPLAGLTVPCLGSLGTTDLGVALAGRPALLNVWASWCQPCREEIPALQAYSTQPGALPVIGINVKDDPSAALSLMAELGANYPSVVDQENRFWSTLQVPSAIPVSYILQADGTFNRVEPLIPFRDADQVRVTIQRYLKAS